MAAGRYIRSDLQNLVQDERGHREKTLQQILQKLFQGPLEQLPKS
jgi:hypothetical protein